MCKSYDSYFISLLSMILMRFASGRNFSGIENQVFLPMITAFFLSESKTEVTFKKGKFGNLSPNLGEIIFIQENSTYKTEKKSLFKKRALIKEKIRVVRRQRRSPGGNHH